MTQPEISFHAWDISTKIKTATISDIISVKKVISLSRTPQVTSNTITWTRFSRNSPIVWCKLQQLSQGGYIVFICNKNNKSTPIARNSSKLKRVSHSTIAAEMLALSDGCNTTFFIQSLLKENIFMTSSCHISIQAFTDNQSLHDAVKTTNLIPDKCLQVELSALREMYDRN